MNLEEITGIVDKLIFQNPLRHGTKVPAQDNRGEGIL